MGAGADRQLQQAGANATMQIKAVDHRIVVEKLCKQRDFQDVQRHVQCKDNIET